MRDSPPATITLVLGPTGGTREHQRPKTAQQLLNQLGIRQCTAPVIRGGLLLHPDRRIEPGDPVPVRSVVPRW